jgi:oligosaccharide repeat unit polymerase
VDRSGVASSSAIDPSAVAKHFSASITIILLGVVVPVRITQLPFRFDLLHLLIWGLIVYCAAAITQLVFAGRPRFVWLLFLVYTYTFVGLAGATQIAANYFPLGGTFSHAQDITAFLMVDLGVVVAHIAYHLGNTGRSVEQEQRTRVIHVRSIYVLSFVSIIVSVAIVLHTGGFGVMFQSRQASINAVYGGQAPVSDFASGAILQNLRNLPVLVCLIAAVTARRAGHKVGALLVLALLAMNVLVNNPISNARLFSATVFLAVFVAFLPPRRAGVFRAIVAAAVIVMVVVFPLADRFRFTGQQAPQHLPITQQFATNGGYDSYQQIDTSVDYVSAHGHTDGKQLLGDLLFFVPRSMWADKPKYTGEVLADEGNYASPNLSAPIWAEGYIDFGWPGVIVYLALLGWIAARLDTRYLRALGSPDGLMTWAAFVPMMAAFGVQIFRGPILPAMGGLTVLLMVPLLLLRKPVAELADVGVPRVLGRDEMLVNSRV